MKGKGVKQQKPQGEMKFYYFDCYALGEPIRMALHKAGVAFKDIRMDYDLPRQQFHELRDQGLFEMGQVPMLELPDGNRLV